MAIAFLLDNPGGTEEAYRKMNRQMFGGQEGPDEMPQGLIIHTAGPTETGFRLFDVWESREDLDRFIKQYVEPALGDLSQGPQPEVYELVNVVGAAVPMRTT